MITNDAVDLGFHYFSSQIRYSSMFRNALSKMSGRLSDNDALLNEFANNLYHLKMRLYTLSPDLRLRASSESKTLLLSKCVLMLFTCIRALGAMLATLVKPPDI